MATKRKRKRSTSVTVRRAPKSKKAVSVARRRRRKSGGLSDAFNPAAAKNAGLSMIKGAAGGFAVNLIEHGAAKFIPGPMGKAASIGLIVGASFITHAVLKQPDVASGMAGALGYSLSKSIPGLNDADFADDDALYDDAPMMDEYGNPMDENGNYLSDDLNDDLNDDGYMNDDLNDNNYSHGWVTY